MEARTWGCFKFLTSEYLPRSSSILTECQLPIYVIFRYWCKWDRNSVLGCGVKCKKFLDNDLADDIKCVKRIFKEHSRLSGNGFNAW